MAGKPQRSARDVGTGADGGEGIESPAEHFRPAQGEIGSRESVWRAESNAPTPSNNSKCAALGRPS